MGSILAYETVLTFSRGISLEGMSTQATVDRWSQVSLTTKKTREER